MSQTGNDQPAVEARALEMVFDSPESDPVRVLSGVDFFLPRGGAAVVTGPSGSGKSTLLGILGGLVRPTSGEVEVSGRSIVGLPERELARLRNREIGFVFQLHRLLPQCTSLENVLIPALAGHGTRADAETVDRARRLLDRVGLAHRMRHLPSELSVGERQRVAVARALLNQPKLLLADEPTGSLDASTAARLADLMLDMNRSEGVAILVATHSTALASRMGTAWVLENGRLESGAAQCK